MDRAVAHDWMLDQTCEHCGDEFVAGEPVRFDIDGGYGDDGTQVRSWVVHEGCHDEYIASWLLDQANRAYFHGHHALAQLYFDRARALTEAAA